MPRTASKQRMRVSTKASSAQSQREQTPVLFRLPEVPLPTLAIDPDPASLDAAPPPPVPPLAVAAMPEGSVDLDSPALMQAAGYEMPATNEPVVTPQATPEAKGRAEVASDLSAEDERSWWEHWSSGVVLILLVIALVTASILAFKDSKSTVPNELVDESIDLESLAVVEDATAVLDSIEIPALPVSTSSSKPVQPSPVAPADEPQPETPAEVQSEIEELQLSGSTASQAPPQPADPLAAADSGVSTGDNGGAATSLVPQDVDSLIPTASNIQTASYDSQVPSPQPTASETQTALLPPLPEAVNQGAAPETSTEQVDQASATGLPPYEQVLGLLPGQSRYPTVSSQTAAGATAGQEQATHGIEPAASPDSPPPQMIQTSTPEADLELLMQRYQEFRAQTEQSRNRYPAHSP